MTPRNSKEMIAREPSEMLAREPRDMADRRVQQLAESRPTQLREMKAAHAGNEGTSVAREKTATPIAMAMAVGGARRQQQRR